MAKSISDSAELTNLFNANSQITPETKQGSEKNKLTLTKNQRLAIATGAVLLGGSAFAFTTLNKEGTPVEPTLKPESPEGVMPADSTSVQTATLGVGQSTTVNGGIITPTDDVVIAGSVNDSMTFEQAYAAAREEVGGGGGIFSWHGNVYNTFTKEEWHTMPIQQRQEFLVDVGFKPQLSNQDDVIIRHEHTHVINVNQNTEKPIPPPPPPVEPIIQTAVINGESVVVIDQDGDGQVDAMIKEGEDGYLTALLNSDGNNNLDTSAIIDSGSGEILDSTPLPEPIEISMEEIMSMDESELIYDQSEANYEVEVIDAVEEGTVEDEDDMAINDDYDNDADVSDIS